MSKHMTIDDRQTIAIGLKQGESLGAIAKQLGKCSSTISREIRSHRIVLNKNPYGRIVNRCINRNNCNLHSICDSDCKRKCSTCNSCNSRCDLYKEERCEKLSRPPYVCNGCSDLPRCTLEKFYYDPIYAQNEYRQLLIESREGFNISADELRVIDDHITPLILNGQSVYHATLACCNELTVSSRSVYRLIDKSALKARNIDLPRKCKLSRAKAKSQSIKLMRNVVWAELTMIILHISKITPTLCRLKWTVLLAAPVPRKFYLLSDSKAILCLPSSETTIQPSLYWTGSNSFIMVLVITISARCFPLFLPITVRNFLIHRQLKALQTASLALRFSIATQWHHGKNLMLNVNMNSFDALFLLGLHLIT